MMDCTQVGHVLPVQPKITDRDIVHLGAVGIQLAQNSNLLMMDGRHRPSDHRMSLCASSAQPERESGMPAVFMLVALVPESH